MISDKKRLIYEDFKTNPLWEVSEDGEISRQTNKSGQISSNWRNQSVYLKENRYYFKYHQKELSVHLAVLSTFSRLPTNTEIVKFIDGDITNFSLDNLVIVPKENNSGKKLKVV